MTHYTAGRKNRNLRHCKHGKPNDFMLSLNLFCIIARQNPDAKIYLCYSRAFRQYVVVSETNFNGNKVLVASMELEIIHENKRYKKD